MEKQNGDKVSVIKLNNEIEFQENSIVSKQIIKKPAGNITLFAFWEKEELTKHSSPYDAFVQILEGEMEIEIGDDKFVLSGGDSILMPADIPHGLKALANSKMLLTMIK